MLHLRTRRGALPAIAAMMLALAIAPIAIADTSLSESGTRGTHRLVDKRSNPGAECKYKTIYSDHGAWAGKLNRLNVDAPRIWATSGTQTVGWRFQAQRKLGSGSWATTYTSGVSKATATTTTRASFSAKTINVNLPADYGDVEYRYRVLVDMFWYAPNGTTVNGSSTHKVDYYQRVYSGAEFDYRNGICNDTEAVGP